jgi:hypothetical protein
VPREFMTRMGVVAALAAIVVLVAAGCGEKTLEQSSAVDLVNKNLAANDLKAESVDCPDDVHAKEGETFQCTVTTTTGRTGVYTITLGKVEGDNVELRITDVKDTTKK